MYGGVSVSLLYNSRRLVPLTRPMIRNTTCCFEAPFCLLLLDAGLPKSHIPTAGAKRSGANAWASAHALSMVTWYHQKIVNGYCLFEPLLLRVLIMNLQIVSVISCHPALQMLSVGVSFIPTLAFCPPNMHIFQSLHTKS